MINIPNFLTSFRVIGATLIPLIILIDSKEIGCFFVLIIFILCSVTDFLDGFITRHYVQRPFLLFRDLFVMDISFNFDIYCNCLF